MSQSEFDEHYSALTREISELEVQLANSSVYKQFADVKRGIEILCEQIAAQKIVAAEHQQLVEVLDSAPVAVSITSERVVRYANRCVSELLGVKVGDRAPDWFVNPGDRDRLLETLHRDGMVQGAEIQLYGANREIRDVLATLAVTQYEGRKSILAWLVDFTERKKMEETLRENRHLLETILEHSPAVIYSKRKDGRYVYINREWEKACNLERETVLGRTDFELFPEDIAQQFRTNDLAAMEVGWMTESEERLDTPLGGQVFLSRKVPLTSSGDDVEGICGISTNITDRRRAELALQEANTMLQQRTHELAKSLEDLRSAQNRLIQTEKLASLGQLTAGIAHEIKNPLNFVNNFSSISAELLDELQATLARVQAGDETRNEITELIDILRGNLSKIAQHGKRADSIVKNMLLHSREGSGEHRTIDINAVVEECVNLAYHGARAEKKEFNVKLERSLDPAAGKADVFPQDITRVLLNLISNGLYAVAKRKSEVGAGNFEPSVAATTRDLGDRVEIKIRDNGTGIPPEVREKIFNPFFTTKPPGEGTGLGLSISHDIIVKQHAGSIEVDSQPGEFTEIRIILPRAGVSAA